MLKKNLNILYDFIFAIFLAGLLTLPFKLFPLDIILQNLFYDSQRHWYLGSHQPWNFFYHYGNIPIVFLIIFAIIIFVYSFWGKNHKWLYYRKVMLFFILVLLLGPGLIVNGILKEHCGRPRPREIVQYNGTEPYVPVLSKGIAGKGKSFPCGHCSMAFMLITPFFIFRKKNKKMALFLLFLGLLYSILMSIARMSQGGHFASDAVWAGIIIYFIALILYYILRIEEPITVPGKKNSNLKKIGILIIGTSISALILFGLALATPYYKNIQSTLPDKLYSKNKLNFHFQKGHIKIYQNRNVFLTGTIQGFGLPNSTISAIWGIKGGKTTYKIEKATGLFTELKTDINLYLSPSHTYTINLNQGSLEIFNLPTTQKIELTNYNGNIIIHTNYLLKTSTQSKNYTVYSTLNTKSKLHSSQKVSTLAIDFFINAKKSNKKTHLFATTKHGIIILTE